jgi:hypothetical protein
MAQRNPTRQLQQWPAHGQLRGLAASGQTGRPARRIGARHRIAARDLGRVRPGDRVAAATRRAALVDHALHLFIPSPRWRSPRRPPPQSQRRRPAPPRPAPGRRQEAKAVPRRSRAASCAAPLRTPTARRNTNTHPPGEPSVPGRCGTGVGGVDRARLSTRSRARIALRGVRWLYSRTALPSLREKLPVRSPLG